MKSTIQILSAVASFMALLFASTPILAAPVDLIPGNVFSVSSTNQVTALSYAVVSARSGNGGNPRVTFVSAGSDLAASKLQGYRVTAQAIATFTNSTVTLPVATTNSGVNWQSGTIIIRHLVDDSYEKRTLTSNTGSTNVVVTVAPLGTTVPGDIIYYATTTLAPVTLWSVAAGTNTLASTGGIIMGQAGKPLLVEINGTSAASLYTISGDYVPVSSVLRP